MGDKKVPQKVILAYFSGTGCTKEVCDCFEEKLRKKGIDCKKINIAKSKHFDIGEADTLMLFSPVYAFRLTSITEHWVKNLPVVNNKSAIIISVSGGGEISPNTACRNYCKRQLKKKGYDVIYEKMLVMPSNFAVSAKEDLNISLLRVLPYKVEKIILDIIAGKKNLTSPKIQDKMLSIIGKGEHFGARFFGASIRASQECNKCGLCVRACPKKNIRMEKGLPKFGFRCMWCLKCIYDCPRKALSPRILKFTVLNSGFELSKMKQKLYHESGRTENRYNRDVLWQGAIDYIREDEY
ncbi:MAG: Ferredoxin [Herbinix sp.]|jgi:flavodoxin/formate hydrogenlyase subunit 6/NADH:ubiquinone oxidoreductase subunit I|nr:Ferredoxin [Herbinix sp.]